MTAVIRIVSRSPYTLYHDRRIHRSMAATQQSKAKKERATITKLLYPFVTIGHTISNKDISPTLLF